MRQIQISTQKTVVTIGNFDGLHTGHIQLIKKAKEIAEGNNLKSLVCNFSCNTKGAPLICKKSQLKESLRKLNPDFLVTLDFLSEIKGLSCNEFAKAYLKKRFQAQVVVVGENFRFGKDQSGDFKTLQKLGEKYGFSVVVAKTVYAGNLPLSSTRIRQWLQNGKIELANRYLFESFTLAGTVQKGYSAGSSLLSYPTANLKLPKDVISLPFGVYQTTTVIDKKEYSSITNIGYAPTLRKKTPVVETHILNFSGDLYQKRIKVIFHKYIRKERKFSSFEGLKEQISIDLSKCDFETVN
ncbi:MAG: bifunctional riboflavin kinase/FAD synthetase [Clostridia bacterium]|nr:bifunctional riboflavin kinase/FAD synthetase [Clostridia bacterium]